MRIASNAYRQTKTYEGEYPEGIAKFNGNSFTYYKLPRQESSLHWAKSTPIQFVVAVFAVDQFQTAASVVLMQQSSGLICLQEHSREWQSLGLLLLG